jgi:hypothetical protein
MFADVLPSSPALTISPLPAAQVAGFINWRPRHHHKPRLDKCNNGGGGFFDAAVSLPL